MYGYKKQKLVTLTGGVTTVCRCKTYNNYKGEVILLEMVKH